MFTILELISLIWSRIDGISILILVLYIFVILLSIALFNLLEGIESGDTNIIWYCDFLFSTTRRTSIIYFVFCANHLDF